MFAERNCLLQSTSSSILILPSPSYCLCWYLLLELRLQLEAKCVSLFIIIYLWSSTVTVLHNHMQIVCAIVAVLLHYLFLSAFCWMLCEGILLFLLLVIVFSSMSKQLWPFLLIGYGTVQHSQSNNQSHNY